jgi:hypothetical protein
MTRPSFGFHDIKPAPSADTSVAAKIDAVGDRLGFASREIPMRRRRRNLAVSEPTDQLNIRAAISDINAFVDWCERERMSYREGFAILVSRIDG